jgi:hypothetical protein
VKTIVTALALALMSGSAALLLHAAGAREIHNQPYQAIVERNAFGLRPIPTPPPVKADKSLELAHIKFTGITTMLGVKKAYFVLPDPAKPKTPNALLYPGLKPGERFGTIQVVSIDEKNCSVEILNDGTPAVLTFSANGNAPSAAGVPLLGQGGTPVRAGLPAGTSRRAIPPGIIRSPNNVSRLPAQYGVR